MIFRNISNILIEIVIFLTLLLAYPFVICQLYYVPSLEIVYSLSITILVVLTFLGRKSFFTMPPPEVNYCFIAQIIYYLISSLIHSDIENVKSIAFLFVSYIFILSLQNAGGLRCFFSKYNSFFCIMAVAGTIAFILVFQGYLEPLFNFENRDGREAWYFGLTFTNVYGGNIIRPAGLFDEPGAFAGWGMYCLIINKLFIKNKVVEIVLFVGLLTTLSIAYYIQLLFYVCFFYSKRLFLLTTISIFSIIGSYFIIASRNTDKDLYILTIERIKDLSEGNSNRTGKNYENAKIIFEENAFWGIGITEMETAKAADNPFEILACHGLIGTLMSYLPLLIAFKKNMRRKYALGIIILLIGYLQRPLHHQVIHYFMIYSLLTLCCYEKEEQSKSISYNNMLQCRL